MKTQDARERRRFDRNLLRRSASGLVALLVVASSLVVGGAVSADPAVAADPFQCAPGTVYVQSTAEVRQFSVDGGVLGASGIGADPSNNALGISSGGRYDYTVTNAAGAKYVAKHDRVTDTTTRTSITLNESVLRGAVNPVSQVYYFASGTIGGGINLFAWDESVTPHVAVQVGTLRPTSGSTGFGANGDMAFSASGQLLIVADNIIYAADVATDAIVASTATIPAKQVFAMDSAVMGNGIAFGNLGHIFVSAGAGGGNPNRIIEVDLARGTTVVTTNLGSFAPTDMASCTFPNMLTLKKDLPSGRHAGSDQFDLVIDAPDGYEIAQTAARTTGGAAGVQPAYAGPIFVNQGDTFALSESAAGTADLDRYATSLRCEQLSSDGTTAPVAVSGGQVTQPAGGLGTEVVCVFVNDMLAPDLELRKTSSPAAGAPLSAGETITYTIEAENTGNTVLDPVAIDDDLSDVLSSAGYRNDVATAIDGIPVASGAATVLGDELAWTGTLQPGQTVAITYSVVVDDDAAGEGIRNSVSASGTPPEGLDPVAPPTVTTENPVTGFEIEKSADPASGTVLEPGEVIEYTITGANTGATALDPIAIADDLSAVLDHAEYNGDLAVVIDGETADPAAISDGELTWDGALSAGQTVTITYSVTVDEDASGAVIQNIATGSAIPTTPDPQDPDGTPVSGQPIVPQASGTQHPVIGSGFTLSKTADPASGSRVDPGDMIEYTVIGTNTGDTVLDPASIVDDLSGVLADAVYNDDVVATRGIATVSDDTLRWSGSLPPHEDVVITYSVRVGADAGGETLRNEASASATPQLPVDPSDPDSPTNPLADLTPPPATTDHIVNEPGFSFAKAVDPASGAAVDPGQVLAYTLTAVNTGETVLDPVEISDDLSGVLSHASYDGDAVARIGDDIVAAPTVSDDELRWSGSLEPGDILTITYSVTVDADAAGAVLQNLATGSATPPGGATITVPGGSTSNPVNVPGFSLSKSSGPETGSAVNPGSVLTYTVTGVNTGETALDPVEIADDLSKVLDDASYNGDAVAEIDGETVGAPVLDGETLRWAGALDLGETVTITYSVTVAGTAGGAELENVVTARATPPGGASDIETPPATTLQTVHRPGFEIRKTADPASGSRVDPGSVITYTVTGVNTGETVLDAVSLRDDLSSVLADAAYNDDAVAIIDGVEVAQPDIDGDELVWNGELHVGQRVEITYSVTVAADAGGQTIENAVTGTAMPPGGVAITPPVQVTRHQVGLPGFTFTKTADPASGTAVATGDVVIYTLTGVNTGETDLDEVVITDDLRGVLDSAEFNDDIVVVIGDRRLPAPALTGKGLVWSGALGEGETVTLTYSVTVRADAAGSVLSNSATATAIPPGGVPIDVPPQQTENRVLTPLAITGGQLLPGGIALSLALLGGGILLLVRRRRRPA